MEGKVEFVNARNVNREQLDKIGLVISHFVGCTCVYEDALDLVMELDDASVVDINNLYFIIGSDWFLIYEDEGLAIEIRMWLKDYSIDNNMEQFAEMIFAFKKLFVDYQDRYFLASLVYSTSYQFYQTLREKGFVEEVTHELVSRRKFYPNTIMMDRIFNQQLVLEMEQFFKILHNVSFLVTDKFLEKYSPDDACLKHNEDLGNLTF